MTSKKIKAAVVVESTTSAALILSVYNFTFAF